MNPIETQVNCPFCGKRSTIVVDPSEKHQSYIEDCSICCRPIQFVVECEDGDILSLNVFRGS